MRPAMKGTSSASSTLETLCELTTFIAHQLRW
jgi:hypothetical protein